MNRVHPLSITGRYIGAIVLVAAAAVLTRMLANIGDAGISPLFFAAVLISAWFGGLGPGLAATILSGIATAYLIYPRAGTLVGARDAVLRVFVFTIVAILASSLHEATKRAAEAFRKARDAAEEASAAKTRFLAMVSHELRTPLSSVMMAADAIAQNPDASSAVREEAVAILRSVELEVRLIDDLVDLSSITSGKMRLDLQPVDLHDPLQAAIRASETSMREKQIEWTTDLSAANRQMIGDPVRLQQVFWNLIRNSVKFTPQRGKFRIATRNVNGTSIVVEVSDTGIGIDASRLSSIFRAFEQGGPDIAARFGGLGLGLAICQALTEAHGGTIRAASDGANRGATFYVEFPVSVVSVGSASADQES